MMYIIYSIYKVHVWPWGKVFGDMTDTFVDAGKFAICSPGLDSYMPEICKMTILSLSDEKKEIFTNLTTMEAVASDSMFRMIDEMKGMLHTMFFYDFIFHVIESPTIGWVTSIQLLYLNLNFIFGMWLREFYDILILSVGKSAW